MLLPNIEGPLEKKRRLLANVAMLVALYEAPVWISTATVIYRRVEMEQIQRKAGLRCISGYRTISAPAVIILAGMLLLEVRSLRLRSPTRQQKPLVLCMKGGKQRILLGRVR